MSIISYLLEAGPNCSVPHLTNVLDRLVGADRLAVYRHGRIEGLSHSAPVSTFASSRGHGLGLLRMDTKVLNLPYGGF